MEKEIKEMMEKASDAIEALEDKIEDLTEDLTEDAVELWGDVKTSFSGVKGKLKKASVDLEHKGEEAQLQAHLGAMEAHDKFDGIKDTVEEFTQKVSAKAQTELDTASLRAHLAKMEAEDFWETKGKKLTQDFSESSDKVKERSLQAASEIKDYFEKLADRFTKDV